MAIRQIRVLGDDVLRKKCKEVKEMTPRMHTLVEDMYDTMYEAMGVGLAAPQVGILKRIVVIDTGEEGECNSCQSSDHTERRRAGRRRRMFKPSRKSSSCETSRSCDL